MLILGPSKRMVLRIRNSGTPLAYSVIITIMTSRVKIDTLNGIIKTMADIRQIGSQKNSCGLNGSY